MERPLRLLKSANNVGAERVLQELIATFEATFPSRIRGYFLEGSYADQSALATSDIDLIILFKDAFANDAERDRAAQLAENIDNDSHWELDISLLEEQKLTTGVPPSLKPGGVLLFGEPVPEHLPLITASEWGRERMHAAYWLMTKVFGRPNIVTLPRDYPQPQAEFYGYTERTIRLADGGQEPSTRDLVRVMGWAGTALVARLGQQIVVRKKECHVYYRKYVDDEWATLFEQLYEKCRMAWQYRIPAAPAARNELRHICRQALRFENHFLNIYKPFLLAELRSAPTPARVRALWVQERIPFADTEIAEEVEKFFGYGKE